MDHDRCQAIIRRLARDVVERGPAPASAHEADRDRIATLEGQLTHEAAVRRELERRLEAVYASETWNAGAALLWLPKKLRDRRRRR